KEVMAGLRRRFPDGVPEGYTERAEFELGVINQKGYPAYFLVVADLVNHAKEVGIRVGPGRGSATGSLVAFALGITNIDPIPHGFAIAYRISKALRPPVMAKDIPLHGIVDPQHERYNEAAEVRTLIETDQEVGKIFETARGLEGLIRNAGVHACAVIMSSEPLMNSIPLWQRDDGSVITGWDYPSCEAIGLLKMDFLGLRNLTVI